MLTSNHDERRYSPAVRIDTLNHNNLFPVARLYHLNLSTPFRTYNNYSGRDLAHHEPSFVEVLDIIFMDPILGDHVSYEVEPALNNRWIFAFGPLVVILTR